MVSLIDNLLKLTEFPFTYSFFGLLLFIFSGETVITQTEENLGPLLILIGYLATVLSIADPIGTLQKLFLRGSRPTSIKSLLNGREVTADEFKSMRIFSRYVGQFFEANAITASLVYGGNIREEYKGERQNEHIFHNPFEKMGGSNLRDVSLMALLLRESTLKTTWVVREVDKVTGMAYSVIFISFFFFAQVLYPPFLETMVLAIQGGGSQSSDDSVRVISREISQQVIYSINLVSVTGVIAVSTVLFNRLRNLREHIVIVFKYLLTREAYLIARQDIDIEDETFEKSLQEIEQYMDNGDWTLAQLLAGSIMDYYNKLFFEKLKLELERKREEDERKREKYKKVNYQELGIY